MPTGPEIKRALRAAGIEVYRTQGEVVHLAERVRENLIMDSGVRVDTSFNVTFYARAEKRDFPGESDDALYARARALGEPAQGRGFAEQRTFVTELEDPSDADRTLDRWYQVQFGKETASLEEAVEEVRFACELPKHAKR